MTLTEPTPTPPSERTPHPKSLSLDTARQLHSGETDLPDPATLRDASEYDPSIHVDNEEHVRTKAERFAILAFLAKKITDVTLIGEGRETRFYQPIKRQPNVLDYISKDAKITILENDLFDEEDFDYAALEVLRLPEYKHVVDRFNQIASVVAESDEEKYSKFTIEDRLGGLSADIIFSTTALMRLTLKHIKDNRIRLSPGQIRNVLIDNIDFLEETAAKNLAHTQNLMRATIETPQGREDALMDIMQNEDLADVDFVPNEGSYKLVLKNKAPKPKTGLFGATLGCPAGYDFEDGDSVIRRTATAIINEAYDRGVFDDVQNLRIPPFDTIK